MDEPGPSDPSQNIQGLWLAWFLRDSHHKCDGKTIYSGANLILVGLPSRFLMTWCTGRESLINKVILQITDFRCLPSLGFVSISQVSQGGTRIALPRRSYRHTY